jgi:hypothetical protein
MKISARLLSFGAVLAGAAVVWGAIALLSILMPGPSGEWAALYVMAAWVVNLPLGLAALAIGMLAREGAPRSRRFCVIMALIALLLPVVASLVWSRPGHRL